jgi:hypothetical protein
MAENTTKLEESFYEATGSTLANTSYLRLFNLLLDVDRETKFLNVFKSVIVNENAQTDILAYDTYEVSEGEFLDNISYEMYETPKLWWVVALFNNFTNPFEELEPGSNIKVLKSEHIKTVFSDMERIAEL